MLKREQLLPSERAGEDLIQVEAVQGNHEGELGFERGTLKQKHSVGREG